MPPKGWRKNADGAYPVTSKERDSISIEDILFPKATVNRLARAIIPEGGILSKDSSTAVQRSSTVFVSYLLVHARQHAKKFDRKTVGPQDIIAALEQIEFSSFIPSVKQELDTYQAHKDALKAKRKQEKIEKGKSTSSITNTSSASETKVEAKIAIEKESNVDDGYATDNEDGSVEDTRDQESKEPQSKRPRTRGDTIREIEN